MTSTPTHLAMPPSMDYLHEDPSRRIWVIVSYSLHFIYPILIVLLLITVTEIHKTVTDFILSPSPLDSFIICLLCHTKSLIIIQSLSKVWIVSNLYYPRAARNIQRLKTHKACGSIEIYRDAVPFWQWVGTVQIAQSSVARNSRLSMVGCLPVLLGPLMNR
jgi:hypothetical protein